MIRTEESNLIDAIARRAVALYERLGVKPPRPQYIASEIEIVHDEIVKLRLKDLLEADEGNFAHDIAGIHRHLRIYKNQSELSDGFMPRFATTE